MDLRDKRVVVVGLGKSGQAAARLCRARGARVLGVDSAESGAMESLAGLGIELRLGERAMQGALEADLVVVSPGVPPLPVFDECAERGIPVISELELGFRFLEQPVLAVGGTNGKSTTTKLAHEMLTHAGFRSFIGGNYGTPVCEAVGQSFDVAVLEVSSFQLERAPTFRPRVSILLNVSEDHLDRYASFAEYTAAKGNAFLQQTADDVAVVDASMQVCLEQAARGQGRLVRYGTQPGDGLDYLVANGALTELPSGLRLELAQTELHGRHNWLNLAAAVGAVRALGADWEAIVRAATRFEPLPHRMSRVGVLNGVAYYDDSKGTNVGAAVTALTGLAEPKAVLIAGGRDKQGSYEPLVVALRERGRALVVLGEAAGKIAAAAAGALPVHAVNSMAEAVAVASSRACPGDAVLLSPACSSFDMYRSYAERGDDFARAVRALTAQSGAPAGEVGHG